MQITYHEPSGDQVEVDLAASGEPYVDVTMVVNGKQISKRTAARRLLSDFLRHEVGLTGTHVGCEHGVCGACTVMIDGETARSCLTLAAQCQGARIVTIEGISPSDGSLSIVQQAFQDCHGLQCGFCTPGFIVSITAFLEEHRGRTDFTDEEIRTAASSNICRCTGYAGIVAAVRLAAERIAEADAEGATR